MQSPTSSDSLAKTLSYKMQQLRPFQRATTEAVIFYFLSKEISQMPKPLESTNQDYEVNISHQYHAFLVCNVLIHDSGRGKQVQLEIQGKQYKASISVKALRVSPNLSGRWRATLHFRCKPDATLASRLSLQRIRPLTTQNEDQPAFWACTGDVTTIDEERGLLEVRVYPGKRKVSKFSLFATAQQEQLEQLRKTKYVHVTGTLEQQRLVALTFEARERVEMAELATGSAEQSNPFEPQELESLTLEPSSKQKREGQ
jgi:hypothetical protein